MDGRKAENIPGLLDLFSGVANITDTNTLKNYPQPFLIIESFPYLRLKWLSMYLERYSYHVEEDFLNFKFTSQGPKGKVTKVVRLSYLEANIYNLAFGDLDELTGDISDTAVTNNGDSIKVLTTVAAIAHDFSQRFPNTAIFAKGSTHSRTRLYRRGITHHWHDITTEFIIFGFVGYEWEIFEFGKDYDAFLIKRK